VLEELERKEVPSQTHGCWSFLVYLCGVGHESSPQTIQNKPPLKASGEMAVASYHWLLLTLFSAAIGLLLTISFYCNLGHFILFQSPQTDTFFHFCVTINSS